MFCRVDSSTTIERINSVEDLCFAYQTILISDYDKGFLHEEDIEFICDNFENVLYYEGKYNNYDMRIDPNFEWIE